VKQLWHYLKAHLVRCVNRKSWNATPLVLILTLWSVASIRPCAAAECTITEAPYAVLHPKHRDLSWEAAKRKANYTIEDTLCALAPRRLQSLGEEETGFLFFASDIDMGIHLAASTWNRPICPCCLPGISITYTGKLPIATPPDALPLFAVVSGVETGSVALANVASASEVILWTIEPGTASATPVDTHELGGTPGTILGIQPAADTAFWVFGTAGLLRRLSLDQHGTVVEKVFDLGPDETVTAVSDSWAATLSGALWQRTDGSFDHFSDIPAGPIRTITSRAATGDDGTVLRRSADGWNSHQVGTANWLFFNLLSLPEGSAIEVFDSAWQYKSSVFGDSPTRIGNVSPGMHSEDAGILRWDGAPDTIVVDLDDPDSNHTLLSVRIGASGELLRNAEGDSLLSRMPGLACSGEERVYLDSDAVTFVISGEQVEFTTAARRDAIDFTCASCYWKPETFSSTARWEVGDTLLIATGSDTLQIVKDARGTVAVIGAKSPHAYESVRMVQRGRSVSIVVPTPEQVREVRLYDAAGRLMFKAAASGEKRLHLTRPLPAGVYHLQVVDIDGTVTSRPFVRFR
jgi:hypothetical protein